MSASDSSAFGTRSRSVDPLKPFGDACRVEIQAMYALFLGCALPGVSGQAGITTAKPGDKPGRTVGRSVTLTTTITAIDLANATVTLTGPEGTPRTIKVREPANLRKVQMGDLVDITYSEAVAIAVRPVAKKP